MFLRERSSFGELLADLLRFRIQGHWRAVRSHQRAVVFLLAIQRAAPLPVADGVRAVSDGVPGHRPYFSFVQRVVDRRPVHRAGLGLHDPEILAFESAGQVVG